MKQTLFFFIFIITIIPSVSSTEISDNVLKKIEILSQKGFLFFAQNKETIYLLGGTWRMETNKKDFLLDKFEEERMKIKHQLIPEQIEIQLTEDSKIFLKKHPKFYQFKNGKFIKIETSAFYQVDTRKLEFHKVKQKKIRQKSQCELCQTKLSLNYVSFDGNYQFSPEIAWVPYFKISDYFGFSIPTGASSYLTENDQLKEEYSIGLKSQLLARTYLFNNYFFEIGGGLNYFLNYTDFSTVVSAGVGKILENEYWLLSKNIRLSGLYFHYSKIDWEKEIIEYKLGIQLTF